MAMATENGWRGVLVTPPNPLAGIGDALRQAFLVDATMRPVHGFADLLARLDRPEPPARGRRR